MSFLLRSECDATGAVLDGVSDALKAAAYRSVTRSTHRANGLSYVGQRTERVIRGTASVLTRSGRICPPVASPTGADESRDEGFSRETANRQEPISPAL
jgi:hypothetical protein